jgi:hypothetical protein
MRQHHYFMLGELSLFAVAAACDVEPLQWLAWLLAGLSLLAAASCLHRLPENEVFARLAASHPPRRLRAAFAAAKALLAALVSPWLLLLVIPTLATEEYIWHKVE